LCIIDLDCVESTVKPQLTNQTTNVPNFMPSRCWGMVIFRFFKRAAVRHLGFVVSLTVL